MASGRKMSNRFRKNPLSEPPGSVIRAAQRAAPIFSQSGKGYQGFAGLSDVLAKSIPCRKSIVL